MRELRSLVFGVAVSLLFPATALAQSAAAWRDSSERLGIAIAALRDSMVQGDSNVVEVARRGDMVIAATPSLRATALEAFERVQEMRDRWFGNALPSRDGFRLTERLLIYANGGNQPSDRGTLILASPTDTGPAYRTEITVETNDPAFQMTNLYFRSMFLAAPQKLIDWLGGPPSAWTTERERRDVAMYAFVTGTGPAQRACIVGDISGCATALGVRVAPSGVASDRFIPLVRADLLLTSLEIGGKEAWSRSMVPEDSTVAQVLASAAGIPIDSLIARWRSDLLARRPNAAPSSTTIVAIGSFWTAALLLAALGASRWA